MKQVEKIVRPKIIFTYSRRVHSKGATKEGSRGKQSLTASRGQTREEHVLIRLSFSFLFFLFFFSAKVCLLVVGTWRVFAVCYFVCQKVKTDTLPE